MPTYDLRCLSCSRTFERFCRMDARYNPCECGGAVIQEFRHSVQNTPFAAYFDWGLGEEIVSLGDRKMRMREHHLDYRDKMSKGALSARLDRIHEQRKERGR